MSNDELAAFIRTQCMDCFDGCCCGLPKNHEGLCVCAAKGCGCTWTHEQADAWYRDIYEWADNPDNLKVADDVPPRRRNPR